MRINYLEGPELLVTPLLVGPVCLIMQGRFEEPVRPWQLLPLTRLTQWRSSRLCSWSFAFNNVYNSSQYSHFISVVIALPLCWWHTVQ